MTSLESLWAPWSPRMLSLLRIVAAFLLLQHGTQKLFGWPAPPPAIPLPVFSTLGIAGLLEFVGGLLLLAGLFTRVVAFILAGEMAVAYFMAHAPAAPWPLVNRGELAVLNCFIFLYIASAGGGEWSADRLIRRSPLPGERRMVNGRQVMHG